MSDLRHTAATERDPACAAVHTATPRNRRVAGDHEADRHALERARRHGRQQRHPVPPPARPARLFLPGPACRLAVDSPADVPIGDIRLTGGPPHACLDR